MDRIHQIQGEAERSKDFTLDTSSPPSEAFLTANESSSKFYSLSEEDSTFIVSPSKGSSSTSNVDNSIAESNIISNLSPIPKTSELGSFQIGEQIEAANILSGGVNIFDDNSYDGDELVIDDNPTNDAKESKDDENESNVSLDKTDKTDAADVSDAIPSKETEVVLQIDGKNVDAIDIGNGLYLYRKTGEEELAAVQIIDDGQQQTCFKFLKVRENAEGNLEVYEEIEIEVPKEMPTKGENPADDASQTPIKDVNTVKSDPLSVKSTDIIPKMSQNELVNIELENKELEKSNKELQESKSELNLNGKAMKFSESRKSPVISTFTPMTYHSTPNKEGIPLTKTMVNQHLQPNRHSDNIKKTIEVNTENIKQKLTETTTKNKDVCESKIDSVDIETKHILGNKDEYESKIDSIDKNTKDIMDHKAAEEVPITCNNKLLLDKENALQDKDDNSIIMGDKIKESDNHHSISFAEINSKSSIETQISILTDCDTGTIVQKLSPTKDIFTKPLESEIVYPCSTDSNKVNSFESKSPLVHESMSDNMELDVDDKLVIAEDVLTITEGPDNVNKPNVVNNITSLDSETIDGEKHSDSSVIIEKIGQTVDKIEGVKESESKEKEANNLFENKKSTTPAEINSNESHHDACKLKDNDEELIEEKKAINFDFITKKNNTLSISETNKDQQHETVSIDSNKIILLNKESDTQQKMEESLKNTAETLRINNSSSQQSSDIKQTDNLHRKEEKTKGINNVKTIDGFKITNNEKSQTFAIKKSNIIPKDTQQRNVKPEERKDTEKVKCTEDKSLCPAVPFGKWTEENRQDFLNKIKETKVITTNSNAKQIKQPNDLNRRDVLKKIDSQRQSNNILISAKIQDANSSNRVNIKASTVTFKNSSVEHQITSAFTKTIPKEGVCLKGNLESKSDIPQNKAEIQLPMTNKLLTQRKAINNQDLIDKTIEGIINRALPAKVSQEDKPNIEPNAKEIQKKSHLVTLDDIERKMNELHGIPFVERPPHELPGLESKLSDSENLNVDKNECTNKHHQNVVKETEKSNISEEEIIEHEPITGDIANFNKEKLNQETVHNAVCNNSSKKEPIITEKDFDKFARRNSVTYENCLTVNFNRREPHNVIQSIVPKDIPTKKMSRNELMLAESKAKSTHKHQFNRHQNHSSKIPAAVKSTNEDVLNKNYQSKVKIAYQSALTAKRQQGPIAIIEDKPVKVVFMDTNAEYVPVQLNVQGQELSPSKKHANENTHSASESMDSDILDISNENKSQDTKSKIKHQRKQVLTPVETPELELIEPDDLGIESSPKKKRRVEEKSDKKTKTLVPKKSYLLNRNVEVDKQTKSQNLLKNTETETLDRNESYVVHSDPISAIDNLVKAAELLETQCENNILSIEDSNIHQNILVKRGRGRPRKYPLPGNDSDTNKTPSPQKNNRMLESNPNKELIETEHSGDEEIKENWTMGKINENIVCPICNKLFRSENVVFKHVKHCTGPSPNRSDSDKRSSRRSRHSEDTKPSSIDSNSEDIDSDEEKNTPRKRKSREPLVKDKREEMIDEKTVKKINQPGVKQLSNLSKMNNLVCELCGKTFRQLSYLLSHKLQHKKEDVKNVDKINKNVFSCEVCKKEFRKLHHLVQHRIIHDPNAMSSRLSRKSSSETHDNKNIKIQPQTKQSEDHSAGFRCEPCDKSFRKLHHLVEHRETHDGINKKIIPQSMVENVKSPSMHQCEICKKTFKKLQHLMEHKDQHLETSSEKSDDKSVQSSLSTRDIIHECSLCYMVFPNEHSLNKHTVICQRKKKQSAAKQAKKTEEQELNIKEENKEEIIDEETFAPPNKEEPEIIEPVPTHNLTISQVQHVDHNEEISKPICESKLEATPEKDAVAEESDSKSDDLPLSSAKTSNIITEKSSIEKNDTKRLQTKTEVSVETIIIPDTPTPKKRPAIKEKIGITVTKKQRSCNILKPVIEDKKVVESSDDDEVRYMLNPKYQDADSLEEKFMKVRAEKRSSLQIERPNSKDLVKRRISLQHPPKIPRLKAKPVEIRPIQTATIVKKPKVKVLETVASTDSDDSDIKYSFPEVVVEKSTPKVAEKVKRKSLTDKRKSLGGVAKRKSSGKQNISSPVKYIRKRFEVEHRCDCGQLFSSAALLSRHTTLAHTPPRIRKRRSPPPDNIKPPNPQPKPIVKQNKPTTQMKMTTQKQSANLNKKIVTRKSSNCDTKAVDEAKTESNVSTRRNAPNRAMPLPEKVRRVNKL